jgi:hypothetical protein
MPEPISRVAARLSLKPPLKEHAMKLGPISIPSLPKVDVPKPVKAAVQVVASVVAPFEHSAMETGRSAADFAKALGGDALGRARAVEAAVLRPVDVGVSVATQLGLAGARLVTSGEVGRATKELTSSAARVVGDAVKVGVAVASFEVAHEVKTGEAQLTRVHAQLDRLQGALGTLLADTKALRDGEQVGLDASRRGGTDEAVKGSVRSAADAMAELRRVFLSME